MGRKKKDDKVVPKLWKDENDERLSYEKACKFMRAFAGNAYITRPKWNGFHFVDVKGKYHILLKNREILVEPKEIQDTDKKDWILVTPTIEAKEILIKNKLLTSMYRQKYAYKKGRRFKESKDEKTLNT